MPLKFDWKSRLFAQSCIELTSGRSNTTIASSSSRTAGSSEVVFTVGFRGSQLALGHCVEEEEEKEVDVRRSVENLGRRCSLPPDLGILEEVVCQNARRKPDVVHWKTKVG